MVPVLICRARRQADTPERAPSQPGPSPHITSGMIRFGMMDTTSATTGAARPGATRFPANREKGEA